MKVLVAGGGGYVGSHVARYLRRAGHVPVVLDDWSAGRPDRVDGIEVVTANASERTKAGAVFEHFSFDAAVAAVAPRPEPRPARLRPERCFPVYVGSAVVLSELCALFGVKTIVLLSSGAVYGETPCEGVAETGTVAPVCVRGEACACAEKVFGGYAARGAFALTVLRLFNVAGGQSDGAQGEACEPERHLVPSVLGALAAGTPFTLWGDGLPTPDGTAVRDLVHVEDVAEAVRLSIEKPPGGGTACYNVSGGRGYSVREVIAAAEGVAGTSLSVAPAGTCPEQAACRVGRNGRLMYDLGWEPRHSRLDHVLASQWRFMQTRAAARAAQTPHAAETSAHLFGSVAVKLGFVTPGDVTRALELQRDEVLAGKPHRLLGLLLLDAGMLTNAQLIEILRHYEAHEEV